MALPADVRLQLETVRLTALFGRRAVVKDVSILFPRHTLTAVIGPSGCGKSTFLRCLNRMHELSEGSWVTGRVLFDGTDIYDAGLDPVRLRGRIGMVFQRTTAPQPEIVLLDEPTASLDPAGTQRIEELCHELKQAYTIVMVTHNLQQAGRVSDYTAFFYLGELIEVGRTADLFTKPAKEQTEAYITGRFG